MAAYPEEYAVVDLAQAQQLQDLLRLWVHVVDTPDAHDEGELGLRLHIEAVLGLSCPLQPDQISFLQRTADPCISCTELIS